MLEHYLASTPISSGATSNSVAVPARDRAHVSVAAHRQAPRAVAGRALAESHDRARTAGAQRQQLPRLARACETAKAANSLTIMCVRNWIIPSSAASLHG